MSAYSNKKHTDCTKKKQYKKFFKNIFKDSLKIDILKLDRFKKFFSEFVAKKIYMQIKLLVE